MSGINQAPPAFSMNPQFTAEHWDKVPRQKEKLKLVRTTIRGDHTEFVFENDAAFMRQTSDLAENVSLHANQDVYIETIKGELVTGLWVPEQGWAFRMSSQDLADYALKLTTLMQERAREGKDRLAQFLHAALRNNLSQQVGVLTEDEVGRVILDGPVDLVELSRSLASALSAARQAPQ